MPATHHPAATHLAEVLHLTGSSSFLLGPGDAARFDQEMNDAYGKAIEEGQDEILIASFSARFLAALVESYKSAPHIITPYVTMLRALMDSGYFAKLMRGPLGCDLYRVHAERVADLDFAVDAKNAEGMEGAIVMLVFLMVYSVHYRKNIKPLSDATKNKLIAVLAAVQDIYEDQLHQTGIPKGAMPDRRALSLQAVYVNARDGELFLRGELTSDKMLGAVGRMMPWVTCGGYDTGCWAKGKQKGRLGCGRCETQTYCSREHQKADWPKHKHSCFETAY
ncbi:hypothetical protein C8R46DRAFT_1094584 [Mycena filopes]|nr:hypothetical protein C8R46DRAFT_1094584 [Mycena filopes]